MGTNICRNQSPNFGKPSPELETGEIKGSNSLALSLKETDHVVQKNKREIKLSHHLLRKGFFDRERRRERKLPNDLFQRRQCYKFF